MSIPYRFPDGSYGRISITPRSLRESLANLSFAENATPVREKYNEVIDGCNCRLLAVSDNYLEYFLRISDVSEYLFGITVDELCTPSDTNAHFPTFPKMEKWDSEKISTMNWDMFLVSLYLFIFSNSDFDSFYWQQLRCILQIVERDISLFKRVTFGRIKNFEKDAKVFWDKIYELLSHKVIRMCFLQTCWSAFEGLCEIKETLPIAGETRYTELERKFCLLMDDIAVEKLRRDNRDEIKYISFDTVNINNVFFYDDYFSLESVNRSAKEKVYQLAFERYLWAADMLADYNQNYIDADELYVKALEYANAEQALLIKSRRDAVLPYIQRQKEDIRKAQRKDRKLKITENITFPAILLAAVAFVVFAVLAIIALIFSLKKLLYVSWVAIIISVAIAIISFLTLKIVDPDTRLF